MIGTLFIIRAVQNGFGVREDDNVLLRDTAAPVQDATGSANISLGSTEFGSREADIEALNKPHAISKPIGCSGMHFAAFDTQLNAPTYPMPCPVTFLRGNHTHKRSMFWQKHKAYLDFSAKISAQAPDDLVVFFDARDVMFAGNHPQQIAERFNEFRTQIVIGAEFGCWPPGSLCSRNISFYPDPYPRYTTLLKAGYIQCDSTCTQHPGYRFLNSGFTIGRAKSVRDMIEAAMHSGKERLAYLHASLSEYDDQYFLNHVFAHMRNRFSITLDYNATLVLNLQRILERSFELTGKGVYSRGFEKYILFAHGNGNGKKMIKHFAEHMQKIRSGKAD